MSVLTNLLPGLRDLRAPLSAGFVWLFVIYLAVVPLPSEPEGVVGNVDDLRKELGPVAQAAALTFAAYILGSFAQGVGTLVVQALRRASIASIALYTGRGPVSMLVELVQDARALSRARRSPPFVEELLRVAHDAAREALSRLETRDIDLLAALETVEWTRSLAKSVPVWRIFHVDVKDIGGSDEAEHDIARQQLMHTVEQNKAGIGTDFGVDADDFEKEVLASGASHVPWLAPLLARFLAQRLSEELEQIRTRLLVDQPELFSKVDRLRAEAEFRAAIAPALIGLAVVLVADAGWLAVASAAMAIVLLYQGASQSRQSDAALVESLRIGRASSPSLDQVRALGTEQWVTDFWRMKEAAPESRSQTSRTTS